ncbi:MAG: 16S rRNA (uracil(1498)-N(3))-methyltransferase [Lachnospiraceae bacterium]|nr:16S rRNA (uracil(1498)-N(3))-methyltransferase [Lachnospiraceae bacterium]
MPKFFSTELTGDIFTLDSDDSKHIKTVLRAEIGERITICDCNGYDHLCEIEELGKNVTARVIEKTVCESEAAKNIVLFQGLPKGDKMESIIQKCVEIGVNAFVPVACERSIVKIDKKEEKKIQRWQKISLSAAKQSGRGIIPAVLNPMTFKNAVLYAKDFDMALIPYEKEKERGIREAIKGFDGKSIAVFIGPEGGFSEDEIAFATENGVMPITLGRRILRTETAGPVTAAVLLYELD